jgi:GNAT superfamily N-acetyltransferase
MNIVIRQATLSDAAPIWAVRYAVEENTLTPGRITDEDLRREIEDTGRGWVLEKDGSIRAFAIGNARTGNVWALFVHPDAQGLGYGRRLHEVMVAWLREQGAPTLWLMTGQHTSATVFYERLGWRRVGVPDNGEARYELAD